MKLLCLDTETGGLDPSKDALVEVAWCNPLDPSMSGSLVLPHDFEDVTPEAAAVNGYRERGLVDPFLWATYEQIEDFRSVLKGSILIGANIAFDAAFLAANGYSGWHYRMLDLESLALPIVGMTFDKRTGGRKLPGLSDVTHWLRNVGGYAIPEPDHTAAGDVRTTVECFRTLRYEYHKSGSGDILG